MGQLSAVRRQLLMNVCRLICNGLVGRIEWKSSIPAGCNVLWCNLCLTTLQACGQAAIYRPAKPRIGAMNQTTSHHLIAPVISR
ncbi:MAG TPA: hypothetical protein VH370_04575 [Humisphaera sp.]|jgi:hypothetical protein|nr:hypothetical protein [Humisphaera sp.]